MREIIYKFSTGGLYVTEQDTAFGNDPRLKIIVEPHEFSLKIGNDTLRNTAFCGCTAVVSNEGEAVFYDGDGNVIGNAEKCDRLFDRVVLDWKQDYVALLFGHVSTVDHYPNCDGEHDRWGTEWVTERTVMLNAKLNSVEVR